jgi:hypothetical protein
VQTCAATWVPLTGGHTHTHIRRHRDTHNGMALCRVLRKSCSGNAEAGAASDAVCMSEGVEWRRGRGGGGEHLDLFVSISVTNYMCCICLSVYWPLTPRPPSPAHLRAAKLSEGSRGAATERKQHVEVEPRTHTYAF